MPAHSLAKIGNSERVRLNQAAVYLQDHLTETLNLEELARTAGFSKFHFHRLFKAWYGETPGDYVKRLRLERTACQLLAEPSISITDLAYQYGFSSSQHFANAFKVHFGVPPVTVRDKFDWRTILLKKIEIMKSGYGKKHCLPVEVQKGSATIRFPQYPDGCPGGAASPELEVVNLPCYRVAFMRLQTVPLSEALKAAVQKMIAWSIAERLFMRGGGQLMNAVEIVPDAEGRYTFDVCITIPEEMTVDKDDQIRIRCLPGGQYGVYHGKFRTFAEFGAARENLMRAWWVSSYYSRDQRPRYVIFYNGPTLDPSSVWLADLCFPITTLQNKAL